MKRGSEWRISVVVISVVTLTLWLAGISFAEDPSGSYKRTCTGIQYDASSDVITANCKRLDGSLKRGTQLSDSSACTGDRENCNGNLRCTGVGLPAGNYKESSFCCYKKYIYNNNTEREEENVCCLCKKIGGKYNSNETCTPVSCAKQIQNINGILMCK